MLLNFDGSFDSVQTLAHELGHAYHNTNLGHRTPLQRQTPMALAETASIFCETIMVQAGLAAAGDDDGARLAILDGDLAGATQVVVDIHSRFLFERALTAERERGVLSAERLQRADDRGPARGLRRRPRPRPPPPLHVGGEGRTTTPPTTTGRTRSGCCSASASTPSSSATPTASGSATTTCCRPPASATAAELAARFGIDVRSVDFWTASLDVLRARIDDFVRLAAACLSLPQRILRALISCRCRRTHAECGRMRNHGVA